MNLSKKQIFILLGFIILLIAIPASLYLVRQQQILKSRADFTTVAEFVDSEGNPITQTSTTLARLRIRRVAASPSPHPVSQPITISPSPSPSQTRVIPTQVCGGLNCQGQGDAACPSGHRCWYDGAGQGRCINPSGNDYIVGDGNVPYSCSTPLTGGQ